MYRLILTTMLLLISLACQPAPIASEPPPATDSEAEQQAVRSVLREFLASMNKGDVAGVLSTMEEGIAVLPPASESWEGKPAVETALQDFFREYRVNYTFSTEELIVHAGWAMNRGQFSRTLLQNADQTTRVEMGKVLILFRKIDDSWKIHTLIWNLTQPEGGVA